MNEIEKYFNGERIQCLTGLFFSLVCIALSIYFFRQRKPFLKGMAWPFLILPALLLFICTAIVIRTPGDLERVKSSFVPRQVWNGTNEMARMESVMTNFSTIKKIEAGIFVMAILLIVLYRKNLFLSGIGAGLAFQAIALFIFDAIAERRGEVYLEFLKSISAGSM